MYYSNILNVELYGCLLPALRFGRFDPVEWVPGVRSSLYRQEHNLLSLPGIEAASVKPIVRCSPASAALAPERTTGVVSQEYFM
jgi:hypothetical protein